jgi:hypothetical protein
MNCQKPQKILDRFVLKQTFPRQVEKISNQRRSKFWKCSSLRGSSSHQNFFLRDEYVTKIEISKLALSKQRKLTMRSLISNFLFNFLIELSTITEVGNIRKINTVKALKKIFSGGLETIFIILRFI